MKDERDRAMHISRATAGKTGGAATRTRPRNENPKVPEELGWQNVAERPNQSP